MTTSHTEFIDIAKAILGSMDSEIAYRTATNRGYYAVHHLAAMVREKLSIPPAQDQSGGSHQRLYNALIECSGGHSPHFLTIRQIGYMANGTLKPYRVAADYHIGKSFGKLPAEMTIAKAEMLSEKAGQLL